MSTATTERAGTGGTGNSLVAVNFKGSIKKYYYWVSDKWQVAVGDEIVVISPSSGETVVLVVELMSSLRPESHQNHKRARDFYRRHTKKPAAIIEEFVPDASARFDAFERLEARALHQHYDDAFRYTYMNGSNNLKRDEMAACQQHMIRMREFMATPPVFLVESSRLVNFNKTPKETTVNIENKTYIDGINIVDLSDDQLFQKIAAAEAQIAVLKKIENKPEKLTQKIVQMGLDIQQLVKLIDAR